MIYDALYISLYKLLPTGGQPVVDMPHEDSAMLRDSSDMAPTSTLNELPPMLVDDVLSLPATVGDQSTKGTTPDSVDSISPLSTAASDGPAKSEHQRQRQVERNKRRRALRHQADLLREQPPKHDCVNPCPSPTCKRILNRFGILDHCKSTHPGLIEMDSITEARFRDTEEIADSDFMAQLQPYLHIPPSTVVPML